MMQYSDVPRRILVCGGRDYNDAAHVDEVLTRIYRDGAVFCHGAYRGADTLCDDWCKAKGIPVTPFPAEWDKYKGSAGPRRNRRMFKEFKPDLVIAFPGDKGTADMIRVAMNGGCQVLQVADFGQWLVGGGSW